MKDDSNGKEALKIALLEDVDLRISERMNNFRPKISPLNAFFTWAGGFAGIVTLAGWMVFGGRLLQRVDNIEAKDVIQDNRISEMEKLGSRSFQAHEAEDNARIIALRERMSRVEQAVEAIPRMESAQVRAVTILEQLQKQIDKVKP